MWTINLKKENPPLDVALAIIEIELEKAIFSQEIAVKILHGYGSHGKGGVILIKARELLSQMKKERKIKDYLFGDKWNVFDDKTKKLLQKDKSLADDEDLNKNNPGITIVVL